MSDPVTMAVVGGSVGAMMNKKDPLKGAMLGALGGYGGATLMPTLGLGAGTTAVGTAANTGLGMAGNTIPGAVGGFGQVVPAIPVNEIAASSVEDLIGQGLSADLALNAGTPAAYTGMGMAGNTTPSFAEEIGKYAQKNPVLTQMAFQTGQSLLQQREPKLQSPGLMRGNQIQAQAPQYQLGIPKVSLI